MVALTLAALLSSSCGEEESGEKDEGDIVTEWDSGGSLLADTLRKEKLFEIYAKALNEGFKFPRDLPVVHTSCGEPNAFYDPRSVQVLMCYELLDLISTLAEMNAADEEEYGERVVATWTFVFFHELGHALIDQYQLPTTGREEDAVDGFSTVLMIEADLADYALLAALYWAETDSGMYTELSYADEHSLNSQRFYNILCLVYGSNPNAYSDLVTEGVLPESRAARCPSEYAKTLKSWETLLEPWAKQ